MRVRWLPFGCFSTPPLIGNVALEMVPVGMWPLNLVSLWGTPITKGIKRQVPFLVSHREQLRNVQQNMPPRFQTGFLQFVHE